MQGRRALSGRYPAGDGPETGETLVDELGGGRSPPRSPSGRASARTSRSPTCPGPTARKAEAGGGSTSARPIRWKSWASATSRCTIRRTRQGAEPVRRTPLRLPGTAPSIHSTCYLRTAAGKRPQTERAMIVDDVTKLSLLETRKPDHALPRPFYTDAEIRSRPARHLVQGLAVCDPLMRDPADRKLRDMQVGEYPVVIVRGADGQIRAFHNAAATAAAGSAPRSRARPRSSSAPTISGPTSLTAGCSTPGTWGRTSSPPTTG